VVTLRVVPVPALDPTEVLIAVHTAGVGSWDADMREGWWPDGERPGCPLVLGTDGSGTIAAVGSRVRRFTPGERVYAYSFANPKGGFYAEYVAVAADKTGRPPADLGLAHAGAIATTGLTAIQGVDDVLHVRPRESRRLGADAAVDGRREDPATAALAFAPGGVDALLAFVGGKPLTRLLDAVRHGGRVAFPNGVDPVPRKRRGISLQSYDATPGVREFERLGRAISAARLEVAIAASYSLGQAAKAHERLAKGHVLGKIVLRVRDR
jgi:NADPH:quinone reductase-like Zn-dependent oxidoreductase